MHESYNGYDVYTYDRLEQGHQIKIERSLYLKDTVDISSLITMTADEIQEELKDSAAAEELAVSELLSASRSWDLCAVKTSMLNKALTYVNTPATEHTRNQWIEDGSDWRVISNMVYKMCYYVYESTRYNRATKTQEIEAWYLSWFVCTNSPSSAMSQAEIAGQDRKRFASKEAMEKYLNGRIKAHSKLFTEISPPIPQDLVQYFKVSGHLLPGYTVEE